MVDTNLRNNLWELFPDLVFFDPPVSDESIIGLALVKDQGYNWVTVYDELSTIESIQQDLQENNEYFDELAAVEFFTFNVLNGYLGTNTPIFLHEYEDGDHVASRFNQSFEHYLTQSDVDSIEEAYNILDSSNTFLFFPLDEVETIKELA